MLGSILACLVVFAFMRNRRSTLIAGIAIPASVISTFGMMAALDFTLNSVTMLALVLMVGIVIDDAIVVLENIFRFIEEKRMSPFDAAREATAEIALPVMATTLCLVVIFIPVSFMSSMSGRFLYQFGLTAAVAILVSLIVSFTLTPMMSARLFRRQHGDHDAAASRQGFYRRIDARYSAALAAALRHPVTVAVLAVVVIGSGYPLYRIVKQEFIPSDVDEAEFELTVTAPEGTSLAAMDEIMRDVERDVRKVAGVRTVLASVGGGFFNAVNNGDAYVPHRAARRAGVLGRPSGAWPRHARSARGLPRQLQPAGRDAAHPRIHAQVPGPQSGRAQHPVVQYRRRKLRHRFRACAGRTSSSSRSTATGCASWRRSSACVDADITLKLDKPELRAEIDRERAADLGIKTAGHRQRRCG